MSLGIGLCQVVKNLWYTVERVNNSNGTRQLEDSQKVSEVNKQLHPLTHVQFASFHSVQRLSPKKDALDKNSLPVMVWALKGSKPGPKIGG